MKSSVQYQFVVAGSFSFKLSLLAFVHAFCLVHVVKQVVMKYTVLPRSDEPNMRRFDNPELNMNLKPRAPGKLTNTDYPSRIERDLANGPLSKLVELLDTQVWGPVQ